MSYNYERGGRRGRYNNYNKNRGARGGYGTRGYMPPGSKTRGYQQYMAPPMSMPTQMGVDQTQFLPPGIMEELKKKVQEKFPDADMSVIQDFFIQNLPINTGFQAMPFGMPNQHNQFDPYGGNQGNKNKKKQFQNKQEQPNPTPQPPPTAEIPLLFVPEEDNVISEVETEHYKEQAEFNAMSADDKKKYIAEKIKLKMSEATQKVKEQLSEIDPENDVKTIFSKMRESLKRLKVEMINNIQKRIEENIAAVRAELYHVRMLWTDYEKEFLQGFDMTQLTHNERREKVQIPKSFKMENLIDKRTKTDVQKYLETLSQNSKLEQAKSLSIWSIYFKDLQTTIRHKFGDINKFEELDYLSKRDIDEVLNKVLDEFIPIHIFSQSRDTLTKGVNPALYSFEWNSNLVNIFQIKERKSEWRVVKFPYGFPSFSRIALTNNGRVFLTGGFIKDQEMHLRTTYEYIEKENTMHRRANMIFRRSDHSVVYNKGYIYAVGAFVEGKFTNSMERYTVSDDDWHKHTNRNNLTSEAQAEETKISEDIWEQKDSMSTPRSGVGLCVFNHNYIYAFGGRNNNNYHMTLIERYDIRSDFWEVINNAKTELWGEGAYLWQAHQIQKNKIIIFGKSGQSSDDDDIKSCYIYTPETGDFEESSQLSQHSAFVNPGISFNDTLYFVGRNFKIHRFHEKWTIYNN